MNPDTQSANTHTAPLIQAKGLSKSFGFRPILRGLDFDVFHGTTLVLLGANGSGKTTLLRILATLSKPSAGQLTVGGWELPHEAAAIRSQIGVVAHQPLLYGDMTAEENLRFFARLYNIAQPTPRIQQVLERVGLARRAHDLVRTFSRGMLQRLAIARGILHNPAILLLDEPYTGLDVQGSDLLDDLFAEWKMQGRTVITSLHDLDRAVRVGDLVLILEGGKIKTYQSMPDEASLTTLLIGHLGVS